MTKDLSLYDPKVLYKTAERALEEGPQAVQDLLKKHPAILIYILKLENHSLLLAFVETLDDLSPFLLDRDTLARDLFDTFLHANDPKNLARVSTLPVDWVKVFHPEKLRTQILFCPKECAPVMDAFLAILIPKLSDWQKQNLAGAHSGYKITHAVAQQQLKLMSVIFSHQPPQTWQSSRHTILYQDQNLINDAEQALTGQKSAHDTLALMAAETDRCALLYRSPKKAFYGHQIRTPLLETTAFKIFSLFFLTAIFVSPIIF